MEQIDISQKLYEKYYDNLLNNSEFKQYIINFNQHNILKYFIKLFDEFSISSVFNKPINQNFTRINYIQNEINEIILNYDNIMQHLKINNLNPIWALYDFKKKIDNLKIYISQISNSNKNMKTNQILNNIIGINNDLLKIRNYYSKYENTKIYIYIKDITDQLKNIEHDYNKIDIEDYLIPLTPQNEEKSNEQNKNKNTIFTFTRPLYSKSPGILNITKSPSPLIIENEIIEEDDYDSIDDSINNMDSILNLNNKNNENDIHNENNKDNENDKDNENNLNDKDNLNNLNNENNKDNENNLNINNLNIVNLNSIRSNSNITQTQNIIIPVNEYNQLSKDSENYNKLLPFKTFSSQKLGVIGESFICEVLEQLNYSYLLTNKIPHVGDIRLTFDNFIIMFEIKNKKNIIQEDITKFKNDINNLKLITNKPVCGCFISLVSNNILNISNLQFNVYETYIPHDNLNISTIQIYIESLKLIFQIQSESNNIDLVISKLNDEMINYSSELEICQKHADYSLQLNKDMIQLKLSLENKLNVIKSILSGINPEFNKESKLKQELNNYISQNKKWTLKECKNIINKYGIMKVFKNKNELLNYLNISK